MKYHTLYFAQAYGEGNYGEGIYSCTVQQEADGLCESTSAGGGTSGGNNESGSGGSGGLADTGIAMVAIVTLACLILFVAFIIRIWRRKPALQEAETSSDENLPTQPRQQ